MDAKSLGWIAYACLLCQVLGQVGLRADDGPFVAPTCQHGMSCVGCPFCRLREQHSDDHTPTSTGESGSAIPGSDMAGDGVNGPQPITLPSSTGKYSQFHIGVDFIESTVVPDPGFIANFVPYPLLNATTNFKSQGGIGDLTSEQLQRQIVMAIEDAFRQINTGDSRTTVSIAIHDGILDPNLAGRRLNLAMGASASPVSLLGQSKQGAFSTTFPQDGYAGMTYLENIDAMGNGGAFVTYDTLSEVIFGIAGTAAHEVGHIFGAVHVNTTASASPQPLMATEGTGLPTSARFTARRFAATNASTILRNAGTVLKGDFNMDKTVDAADATAMFANWALSDRLFHEGDANNDHLVDALDAGLAFENWTGDSGPTSSTTAPLVSATYNAVTGELLVAADGVLNWFVQSPGGSLAADQGPGAGTSSSLLTANAYRLGQTSFDGSLLGTSSWQNVGTELTDLEFYFNASLGSPLLRGALTVVPEPLGLGSIAVVLLVPALRRFRRMPC